MTWDERWRSVTRIWPSLLLIAIIMVLLYTGIVTATEVAAVGTFMAALIGVVLGRLKWTGAFQALKLTLKTSAMIFTILIGANIFGSLHGDEPGAPADRLRAKYRLIDISIIRSR